MVAGAEEYAQTPYTVSPVASSLTTRRPEIHEGLTDVHPLIRPRPLPLPAVRKRVPVGCAPTLFCFRGICFVQERPQLPVFPSACDWLIL